MRILILTVGSRGDVEPFLGLGAALRARGLAVRIVTGPGHGATAARSGIEIVEGGLDPAALAMTPDGRAALAGSVPAALRLLRDTRALVGGFLDRAWAASEDVDAVIHHPKALGGSLIAAMRAVPAFPAATVPLLAPTRAFPSPILPVRSLGTLGNRLSHHAALGALAMPYRGVLARFRDRVAGEGRRRPAPRPLARLHGFSEALVERPGDWGPDDVVTGPWLLPPDSGWTPPGALVRFLAAGPPPVHVGFGSMTPGDGAARAGLVVEAARRAGLRVVLACGWGGLEAGTDAEHALAIGEAPHDWLFPRCAALVHHGGSGTTHAGLRHGRPTLVCPVFGDQPFWGRLVAARGAGPEPIPLRALTVERLAEALRALVSSSAMREAAEGVARRMRADGGAARAAAIVEERLARRHG
jgi:UDP:flavonoid glycosyltransferase YjiC (YdhE family)